MVKTANDAINDIMALKSMKDDLEKECVLVMKKLKRNVSYFE